MDLQSIVIAVIGLTLAGVIKGATGLGYTSCALPFLVIAMGLKPAMIVVLLPALATNIGVAVSAGHFEDSLRRFKVLYLGMVPGIAVGVNMLVWVPQAVAVKVLGCTIVAYVVLALSRPRMSLAPSLEAPLQLPTGFLNGLLTGLTGAQVMPLFPYVMSLNLDTDRTVQAINIAVLLSTLILAAGLATAGFMTSDLLVLSLIGVAPAMLGVAVGNSVRRHIPHERYKSYALATLLLMGAMMLAR
ncbi:MAG: sulfite exporter TauE/SafE family protein [Hyphomicrobiaceae bacterium]|nr:sulfite exporter TauE/SafE family protein [Hyphomicrobiaceae bacterium]